MAAASRATLNGDQIGFRPELDEVSVGTDSRSQIRAQRRMGTALAFLT